MTDLGRLKELLAAEEAHVAELRRLVRQLEAALLDQTGPLDQRLTLAEATDLFQKRRIQTAVKLADGNMTEAARLLGMHRPNLYRKMRDLGLL